LKYSYPVNWNNIRVLEVTCRK